MRHLDTAGGVSTFFEHDHRSGRNIIRQVEDVEPVLDQNARYAAAHDPSKEWWFVGTIPDTIIMQWSRECSAKPYSKVWREYAARQLNKAEYAKLNPNRIRLAPR